MNRTEEPQHPMPIIDPAIALSSRQEAFCRHYAASAPGNDLPSADDPPEETCEYCPWAPGDGFGDARIDDDRADNAEHDWLYERRYDYDEICDPWAPEEVEERRRSRVEREERGGGEDGGWSGPATPVSPRTMTKHDTS